MPVHVRRREREKRAAEGASGRSMVQIAVRLDPPMIERLRNGAHGLSDEIRDRLERTYKYDEVDPVTRELAEGLINIAALLRFDFGAEWHVSPQAYEAFAAAMRERLAGYEPPPGATLDAPPEILGPGDPPAIIGRMRERDDRRTHARRNLTAALKAKSGATD
jgi:hypothetical protein